MEFVEDNEGTLQEGSMVLLKGTELFGVVDDVEQFGDDPQASVLGPNVNGCFPINSLILLKLKKS